MTNKEFLGKADFLIGRYNYRLASMCKCFGNDGDKTHLYAELIALDNFCEGLEGRTLEIVLMDERKKEIMEQYNNICWDSFSWNTFRGETKELSDFVSKELKRKAKAFFTRKTDEKNFVVLDDIVAIKIDSEIKYYDAVELTKSWINTSNDTFFEFYRFNWIPPAYLRDQVQNQLQSQITSSFQSAFMGYGS